jgi:dimethylargininase
MFSNAIVKLPCRNLINGLTTADFGNPDYRSACIQHQSYIEILRECGLNITILDADEDYPDSVFIEDTALLTPHCAIITNPGAHSRKGEIIQIKNVLKNYFSNIHSIEEPGTLEAGDVMMTGSHYYIGLSARTNLNGAHQLISILEKYGMIGSTVPLQDVLHLKSGVSYIENNCMLASGAFINHPDFQKFHLISVDNDEAYAANSLWINGRVLVPKGFSKVKKKIENAGYITIEADVSEFRKLDGGLSCLSLRF